MSRFRREIASLRRATVRMRGNPEVDFHHGLAAQYVYAREGKRRRRRLRKLGELRGVVYTTRKGGDPITDYVHGFEGRKPVLAMDKRKNLHIVRGGSRYTITRRGIEG